MSLAKAIVSGFIGASTLTLIHETVRRLVPNAPRMDILGMRAIEKSLRAAEYEPPQEERLHTAALVGDLLANSLYYSAVGIGRQKHALLRGAVLGAAAGVGGVLLPGPLGLGEEPSARTNATKLMTVAWYLVGGLAAGVASQLLAEPSHHEGSG